MTVQIVLTEEQTQALEYADAFERSSTDSDRALAAALSAEAGKLVFESRDAGVIRRAIEALDTVGAMEEGFDPEYAEDWRRHCETLAGIAAKVRPYESALAPARRRDGFSL